MAKFAINDIVIDRIQTAVAFNSAGDVLYTLNQLNNAQIQTTSESKEARDKDGSLIRKIFTGKSGTFTCTNALLNANIIAEGSGSPKTTASADAKLKVPFIHKVKAGSVTQVEVDGMIEDSVKVIGESADGAMVATYLKDTAVSATAYAVAEGKVLVPTDTEVGTFVVTGEREIETGAMVQNRSDKFPKTVHLLVKALGFQVCEPDILRAIYVDIPSFQPSPDQDFQLATDATLDFTGDMQVSYCGNEGRELYSMYFPDDDIED